MAIFLTGSTGYIGAHVAANLLDAHGAALNVLVRAKSPEEAAVRLWNGLQLHMDFPRFYEHLHDTPLIGNIEGDHRKYARFTAHLTDFVCKLAKMLLYFFRKRKQIHRILQRKRTEIL